MTRDEIFDELYKERELQDEKWGQDFDNLNTINDWVTFITMYASKAAKLGTTAVNQRAYIMKATAIGVAALEAWDRNDGRFAKRHYEVADKENR